MPNLKRIDNVEIFSEGVWNGKTITSESLDSIIEAYNAIKEFYKPYLKLGHTDKQKLAQEDGLPRLGSLENFRKVGTKIVADIVDMPEKIFELVQNKSYTNLSSEIFRNIKFGGKQFDRMIAGVALLGADMPGVLDLQSLRDLFSINDQNIEKLSDDADEKEFFTFPIGGGDMPKSENEINLERDLKDLKEKVSSIESERDDYKAKVDEASKLKEELATRKEELEKYKSEAEKREKEAIQAKREKFTSDLEKEKLSTPAVQEHIQALVGEPQEKYKIGKKELSSREEVLKDMLKNLKESYSVNLDEGSEQGEVEVKGIESKIEKYMQDNECTYTEAYKEVGKEHLKVPNEEV